MSTGEKTETCCPEWPGDGPAIAHSYKYDLVSLLSAGVSAESDGENEEAGKNAV